MQTLIGSQDYLLIKKIIDTMRGMTKEKKN